MLFSRCNTSVAYLVYLLIDFVLFFVLGDSSCVGALYLSVSVASFCRYVSVCILCFFLWCCYSFGGEPSLSFFLLITSVIFPICIPVCCFYFANLYLRCCILMLMLGTRFLRIPSSCRDSSNIDILLMPLIALLQLEVL